jgi:hypothetical protein
MHSSHSIRWRRFSNKRRWGLKLAPNLDDGSVACQGISLSGFARRMCGRWEIQADGDVVRKLVTRVHGTSPWRHREMTASAR